MRTPHDSFPQVMTADIAASSFEVKESAIICSPASQQMTATLLGVRERAHNAPPRDSMHRESDAGAHRLAPSLFRSRHRTQTWPTSPRNGSSILRIRSRDV